MAFALSLSSGNASAAAITALWDQMSAFEDSPSMRALNYPPHVTFAVYDSPDVMKEMAVAAMELMVRGRSPIEIGFSHVRSFAGPPLVLWADPEPKDTLLEMHRQVHAAIDPAFCKPHYRPGNWVPHCTLATRTLPDRGAPGTGVCESFSWRRPRRLRSHRLREISARDHRSGDKIAGIKIKNKGMTTCRHCEERSGEAIRSFHAALDCFEEPVIGRRFAPARRLAMTNRAQR